LSNPVDSENTNKVKQKQNLLGWVNKHDNYGWDWVRIRGRSNFECFQHIRYSSNVSNAFYWMWIHGKMLVLQVISYV